MDTKNTELLIHKEFEEDHVFTEEEAKQIKKEALMICANALQDVQQDVSELRADFVAQYQTG